MATKNPEIKEGKESIESLIILSKPRKVKKYLIMDSIDHLEIGNDVEAVLPHHYY